MSVNSATLTSPRQMGRSSLVGLVLLVLSFATLFSTAAPADAATRVAVSGSPGSSTVPFTYAADYCDPSALFCEPAIYTQRRTVTESYPYRNSWQYVCVTQRYYHDGGNTLPGSGSWIRVAQRTDCAWISPTASSVAIAGSRLDVWATGRFAGDWATDFRITWTLQNGTQVGAATYDYVHQSDYRCYQMTLANCTTVSNAVGAEAGIRL